ncbi:MAG: hypothetical protein IK011_00305, partial [Bacteroidaceae bacterium]|nr:hypothetical protein [Bacteroidaceae bacterium]
RVSRKIAFAGKTLQDFGRRYPAVGSPDVALSGSAQHSPPAIKTSAVNDGPPMPDCRRREAVISARFSHFIIFFLKKVCAYARNYLYLHAKNNVISI